MNYKLLFTLCIVSVGCLCLAVYTTHYTRIGTINSLCAGDSPPVWEPPDAVCDLPTIGTIEYKEQVFLRGRILIFKGNIVENRLGDWLKKYPHEKYPANTPTDPVEASKIIGYHLYFQETKKISLRVIVFDDSTFFIKCLEK